jgi:Cu+-exporting ATPase
MAATATNMDRATSRGATVKCFHCGTPCRDGQFSQSDKSFCCQGCSTVFELLNENGLAGFYDLADTAGVRVRATRAEQFNYLDAAAVRERLVDFQDARLTRATFHIPAIHCIACVWLLENLFRLNAGIGESKVDFPRKEVSVAFATDRVKLSEVVSLLASLGYEPELKFSDLEAPRRNPAARRLWMQLGFAGFAFGNLMLLGISDYLGLDTFTGPTFRKLTGFISFALALPVFFYSALDYWRAAWRGLRRKLLTIEVPIAAGLVAIFAQSSVEVWSGRGAGYFDSLCGLVFFLLCGKLFQQKTFDSLSFERDYKSFFPLSVNRCTATGEESAALSELRVGDRLTIRHGELIPADARLAAGAGRIDYSFVTGESEPAEKAAGDYLYAGGRQIGGAIEIEILKPVSQSYLTSLWNQEAFRKDKGETLQTLTNIYSFRFTKLVIAIAIGAGLFWLWRDPSRSILAFTSVLIVACPCALALAAPFTLGTALRVLGRRRIYVKSPVVVETLARVDTLVFDKTGTLTAAGSVAFQGTALTDDERRQLHSLARQSTHPLAVSVAESIADVAFTEPVRSFVETAGVGIEGLVGEHEIWMGSATWLRQRGVKVDSSTPAGSTVHVAMDGIYRGHFTLLGAVRPETERLMRELARHYELSLLSGDNEREQARFKTLLGPAATLHFHQSPLDKYEFIRRRQHAGRTVMMVGDGLNDAGALKQSDVGVAVVERVGAFSPASDVIMAASMVPQVDGVLRFARQSVRIVRLSFLISSLYNVIGISIAAAGLLSPVVCAILMPISSLTVVGFACAATAWAGRHLGAAPVAAPSLQPEPMSEAA